MSDGQGLIIILTGEGKGKTTSAFGMVLRACGHGLRASVIQFVKADESGEVAALSARFPEIETVRAGLGFVPQPEHPDFARHKAAAHDGLQAARGLIRSGRLDLVVLDEIICAMDLRLLAESDILELMDEKPARMHLALTGRGATPALVQRADLVTEMRCVKHPYDKGIKAAPGIEY
ncbi:MAG TPA: cob(I)yrinic acid a,c-diamide adenosyltransferase [Candidatus Brocadiia bacterium]|nr:cob(I)yrinic acid a,c-diamide adenosyltransferase [Candidatus Brocadiia bacterium]